MKFKVGDKVRVREDLVVGEYYDDYMFAWQMEEYKGKIFTIMTICNNNIYFLEEVGFSWTDEMLEEVKENKMEKTILEIINEGYTGKKYVHESGTIAHVDCENVLRFDYRESNRISSDRVIGRNVALDMKLKEYRKQYTFHEAFKAYEEGKEIESVVTIKFKKIKGVDGEIFDGYWSGIYETWLRNEKFSLEEIRGKWYIND